MENNHLLIALSQYGLKETPGAASNPVILQMAKDCGFKDYTSDGIAWCSLFMNWVMWKALKPRSNSLLARSWINVGEAVQTPVMGDIAVLWRVEPNSPYGHTGIYISESDTHYYLLSGNTDDMVNIAPFRKDRLLGFRRV